MTGISGKKRLMYVLIIANIILFGLTLKVIWIQFIKGEELKTMAYIQQTQDRNINPKRGTIYDATGKTKLAVSASVETITINPLNIPKNKKEEVSRKLSELFELDYEKVVKKVNKHSSVETIVKKVTTDKTDELRKWMKDNNISTGINIDEDTKRYYPYNDLASQVIGFTGADNQGLNGIEAFYDKVLKGEKGRIIRVTDARGGSVKDNSENYIKAKDGNDIYLTIDSTVQNIAEKYLTEACIDNKCTDGGNIVIANPKTGDILAMATYPGFNLNIPYEINNEELKNIWNTIDIKDRNNALQQMWRNKAIADTYEPGSTFKLITTSAALEEGITTPDKEGEFCCTGGIDIAGVRIKCWRYYRPHGPQSLRMALKNSCNPVFIGLGQKIGVKKYYEYLKKFGYLDKVGIDLSGEAKSIFLDESKVGPVELATISFGQRFEVTPLQMVSAVSAIANNGERMQLRLVKTIVNSETGEKEEINPVSKGQVISKKTSEDVLSMMGTVVAEGTGKNAQVKGYQVGGKTGTSEDGVNTHKYVTSFVGIAPITDPQVVILVTLYNPTGEGGHQGGAIAAPIAGQVLGDVLPYLNIKEDNEENKNIKKVEVPNICGLSIKDARKQLKDLGLELEIKNSDENQNLDGEEAEKIDENEIKIKNQIPENGSIINAGNKIICNI